MSLEDLGLIDYEIKDKALLIDGDLIIFQNCCIFNDDDDQNRSMITKHVNSKITSLMEASGCNMYIMFVTTNYNFRDHIVNDYKGNRVDKPRPINLAWAKEWAVANLNTHFVKWMEADDLLGTHQTPDTVIWSQDKDLRQIEGKHLDDATMKLVDITSNGSLRKTIVYKPCGKLIKKTKYHFTGNIGLYFQLLTGDTTDWIVGCGERVTKVYKSGAKKGQKYLYREGVGPGDAYDILVKAGSVQMGLKRVADEYFHLHGDNWMKELETQANLLFMVREHKGDIIKQWTYDGRDKFMNITTGEIVSGFDKEGT